MLFKRTIKPFGLKPKKEDAGLDLVAGEIDNGVGDWRVATSRLGQLELIATRPCSLILGGFNINYVHH
ncbi:hypothetical protein BER2_3819 [plant metagenome]|uniref:Uncharacterized protein n=1 Tax=plant metagenome TaxID=1297885 RepID=A0A484RP42_9ZZZZ